MPIHARSEFARQYTPKSERERIAAELATAFSDNQADVYVLTRDELEALWVGLQKARGRSNQQIEERFLSLTGVEVVVSSEGFEVVKAFGATAVGTIQDGRRISILAQEMKRSGNILGTYYTKVRNGRTYIIFRGRSGLRKVLTGTIYLSTNIKLIKLGVGVEGVKAVSRSGASFAIFASVTLNTIQWLFDSEFGWNEYSANLTTDVMKTVLATASGYLVGSLLATSASIAVLPVGVGVVVTIAVGYTLHVLDRELGLTERLATATSAYYHLWGAAGALAREALEQKRRKSSRLVREYVYGLVEDTGEALLQIASQAIRNAIDEALRSFISPVRRL